ncbi:hypothetical protein BJ508DRAFT_110495 [Ascobolus immersus RN42]|uniref:Uncharacterized protein n=1 Tax=Ascobolus immersus RN42 TaxID=1160509 RepID=A0A3N4H8K1_ASCIM|nr:hypothetical protein BJ508DRAFT_110495 [Ascobolus immersus RN42]
MSSIVQADDSSSSRVNPNDAYFAALSRAERARPFIGVSRRTMLSAAAHRSTQREHDPFWSSFMDSFMDELEASNPGTPWYILRRVDLGGPEQHLQSARSRRQSLVPRLVEPKLPVTPKIDDGRAEPPKRKIIDKPEILRRMHIEQRRRKFVQPANEYLYIFPVVLISPTSTDSFRLAFEASIRSLITYIDYTHYIYKLLKDSPELEGSAILLSYCIHNRNTDERIRLQALSDAHGKEMGLEILVLFRDRYSRDYSDITTRRELVLLGLVLALIAGWVRTLKDPENEVLPADWNPLNRIVNPRFAWLVAARSAFEMRSEKRLVREIQCALIDKATEVMIKELKSFLLRMRGMYSYTVFDVAGFGDRSTRTRNGRMCWERLRVEMKEAERMFEGWERMLGFFLELRSESIEARIWKYLHDDA